MSFENPFPSPSGAPRAGASRFQGPCRGFVQSLSRRWSAAGGYRHVLRVSLPLVASMASSTIMEFTDRLFLSHYSVEAIAACVPASLANLLFLLACMGISGYAGVFIAQFVGAGRPDRVGPTLWQSLRISAVAGIFLLLLLLPAPKIFALAGHEPAVLALELKYFNVLMAGSWIALLGSSLGCFYSGRGHTRPLMLANIAAVAVNIPLDYALIYGRFGLPELGIFGAGLATVCGWLLATVLLAFMIFTRKNNQAFHIWKSRALDTTLLLRMLRFGLPSGVNSFLEMFTVTWFAFAVGRLGEIAQAATNIVLAINSVSFLPMLGFNFGASILVGQAMGAKNPAGARWAAVNTMHIGVIWMAFMAAIFLTLPGPLMDLFSVAGDPAVQAQVRQTGIILFGFLVLYCCLDAFCLVFGGALKGAGDTWFLLKAMLLSCAVCILAPIAIMFATETATLVRLWLCFSAHIALMGAIVLVRFFRGSWKKIRVLGHLADPGVQ